MKAKYIALYCTIAAVMLSGAHVSAQLVLPGPGEGGAGGGSIGGGGGGSTPSIGSEPGWTGETPPGCGCGDEICILEVNGGPTVGPGPTSFGVPSSLHGITSVPVVTYDAGVNYDHRAGPHVKASVNGRGGASPVFLGNGASHYHHVDLQLPLNGIDWFHTRTYSSINSASSVNWHGENWWSNEMMFISGNAGDEDDSDCTVTLTPHYTLSFDNTATATWTTEDNYVYTLTYSSGDDEFILTRVDGVLPVSMRS